MKFSAFILVLLVANSALAEIAVKDYTLRAGKNEQLVVSIERDWSPKTGLENVTCKFFRVSGGVRKLVEIKRRGVGFRDLTILRVANFLNEDRKQVFVFMEHGSTFGAVFDFDGQQVKTVYDSDAHGPRVWLRCVELGGHNLIEEGWTPTGFSEPGFSLHRKSDNLIVRLIAWDGTQWSPLKFRLVDGQPVPLHRQ